MRMELSCRSDRVHPDQTDAEEMFRVQEAGGIMKWIPGRVGLEVAGRCSSLEPRDALRLFVLKRHGKWRR